MKQLSSFLLFTFLSATLYAQSDKTAADRDREFYAATKKWFDAWELVSKKIYTINDLQPVHLLFFDDEYVYSTSSLSIPDGTPVKAPAFMNLSLQWKKALHNGTMILPDSSIVSPALMTFASPSPDPDIPVFFVMPLPSFWETAGVASKELELDHLITGVFLHEFSHSQQMQNFGKQISAYEEQYDFDYEMNDNIVQSIFQNNTAYVSLYQKEVDAFYGAVKPAGADKNKIKEGLETMRLRKERFFTGKYAALKEIDDFFLTMEGLGQYSMYLWFIHPEGGNLPKEQAIAGVRRNKKWWSQEEGFGLFLVLDQLAPPATWVKNLFGDRLKNVTTLINEFLR